MKPCHELAKEQIAADEAEGQANADDDSSGARQGRGLGSAGCTKDTDCKGDRICQNGKCASPGEATAHAAPAGLVSGHFDTSTPGVVVDTRTSLMWQRGFVDAPATMADAGRYCANLALAGHSGWRLPTKDEIVGLFPGAETDLAAFPGTPSAWFGYRGGMAYFNNPVTGGDGSGPRLVRCVR